MIRNLSTRRQFMTPILNLTEDRLIAAATDKAFTLGKELYIDDAVIQLIQITKSKLVGQVKDEESMYTVNIFYNNTQGTLTKTACTCPYNTDGCKHIIAALLYCLHTPQKIVSAATLDHELDKLTTSAYKQLIIALIQENPALFTTVTEKLAHDAPIKNTNLKKESIDPGIIIDQTYEAIHILDNVPHWQHDGETYSALQEIIDKAHEFLEVNDGHNALIVLSTLTDTFFMYWEDREYMEPYDSGDFLYDLDEAWVELLLATNLNEDETNDIKEELLSWQKSARAYGFSSAFEKSLQVLNQGWDSPEMKKILTGHYHEPRTNPTYTTKQLARQVLSQLEKERKYIEYEHLAHYEGLAYEYVYSLILQNRFDEVAPRAQQVLTVPGEAQALAKDLYEVSHYKEAFAVASHGLTLKEDHYGYTTKAALGDWLGPIAEQQGNRSLALQAYLCAFKNNISLERYKNVLRLNNQHKEELLTFMRKQPEQEREDILKIYLYEQLYDEAIAVMEGRKKSIGEWTIKNSMEGLVPHKPVWVIKQAREKAEAIIDEGIAKKYAYALTWLDLVRRSYESSNDRAGWHVYLDAIRRKYHKKRKLMALLSEEYQDDVLVNKTYKQLEKT